VITLADFLTLIGTPPGSTIFVICLSALVSTITSLLTRILTDQKELNRKQDIIKEHQQQKKELERLKVENPKKWAKDSIRWKRREKAVQKMQQSISFARMKPTCITFVPMLVIFFVLNQFFAGLPVALPPMDPYNLNIAFITNYIAPSGNHAGYYGWINFFTWYFLTSFAVGTVIQRLFGVAQTASFSQMLGQQGSGFSMKS
jgi:uncharacterized membrane protein (DUF106 family)